MGPIVIEIQSKRRAIFDFVVVVVQKSILSIFLWPTRNYPKLYINHLFIYLSPSVSTSLVSSFAILVEILSVEKYFVLLLLLYTTQWTFEKLFSTPRTQNKQANPILILISIQSAFFWYPWFGSWSLWSKVHTLVPWSCSSKTKTKTKNFYTFAFWTITLPIFNLFRSNLNHLNWSNHWEQHTTRKYPPIWLGSKVINGSVKPRLTQDWSCSTKINSRLVLLIQDNTLRSLAFRSITRRVLNLFRPKLDHSPRKASVETLCTWNHILIRYGSKVTSS